MSNPIPLDQDVLLQSNIRRYQAALLAADLRSEVQAIRRALDEMSGGEPQAQARGVPWGLPDPFAPSGEDEIARACARVDALADQIASLDDLSALRGAPRLERVRVTALLERVAAALAGVTITRETPALECTCDPAQMELALYGLAESACHEGGPVRLRAEAMPGQVRFMVTGLGDVDVAGLAVAQEMVAKHGGKLWAESEEGIGSTFVLLLPEGVVPR